MSARDEVERIHRQLIGLPPEWSEQQKTDFIAAETTRVERIESQTQATLADHALEQYRKAHDGMSPEYLEHVGMLRTTQLQATEIALAELYEQVPPREEVVRQLPDGTWVDEDMNVLEQADLQYLENLRPERELGAELQAAQQGRPDRWKTPFCSDPMIEHEERVSRLWPGQGDRFLFKMGELWAARFEDGLALPDSIEEPMAAELEKQVREHLAEKAAEQERWERQERAREQAGRDAHR